MSNKIWKSVFVVCAAGCLASCSDQMDYNEYNIFDKAGSPLITAGRRSQTR